MKKRRERRQEGMGRPQRLARALCLSSLLLASACASEDDALTEVRVPEHRLLLIGWDGATFDLIDPMLRQGKLPHLRALLDRGTSANLASTMIPISSAAWAGATTGKGPGQTGVYSFFEPAGDSYDVRLISSRSNRATPIWRTLSGRGLRVNVIGVPVTFPPEPVLGTMIAGMLSPFDAPYAWPHEYTDELRAKGFVPDLGIWREDQELSPELVEEQLDIKASVVLEHLSEDNWVFSMVVFKNLDVLSHRVYDGRPDGAVAHLLERLDSVLGRMVETVGPKTNVILMSDHGFASYGRGFNLHAWMLGEGYSVATEGERPKGGLPETLDRARAIEHQRRLGELDLTRTRAYATAAEGNFGSLRLNLAGREPRGTVAAEDADALLTEIERGLRAIRVDERPLVTNVFRGAELYPGPETRVVPDLIFEVTPDTLVSSTTRQGIHVNHVRPQPDHALQGILVLAGPDVPHEEERGAANVIDIAPTALHLLDQPVFEEMDGAVRVELLSLERAPRRMSEADDPTSRGADAGMGAYTAEELEEIEERMRKLGYVQ